MKTNGKLLRTSRARSQACALLACAMALALTTVTVANAQERFAPFYLPVTWLMRAVGSQPAAGPQEVATGEMLFVQSITSARQVTLQEDITVPAWLAGVARPIAVDAGTTLFQVSGGPDFAFCDGRITDPIRNSLTDVNGRLCLIDRENDGTFDLLYWAGFDLNSGFMPMALNRARNPEVSVRYSDSTAAPLLQAGLMVTKRIGGYQLSLAIRHGPTVFVVSDLEGLNPIPARRLREVRFRARDLPMTFECYGARITITEITGDIVHYQLASMFNPDAPLGINVTRSLSPIEPP